MLSRIWKIVKVMFKCVIPDKPLHKLENASEFSLLSDMNGEGFRSLNYGDNGASS